MVVQLWVFTWKYVHNTLSQWLISLINFVARVMEHYKQSIESAGTQAKYVPH